MLNGVAWVINNKGIPNGVPFYIRGDKYGKYKY